jgi:hypothetical protein
MACDNGSGGNIYEYDRQDNAWIDIWTFYADSDGTIYRATYSQKRGDVFIGAD